MEVEPQPVCEILRFKEHLSDTTWSFSLVVQYVGDTAYCYAAVSAPAPSEFRALYRYLKEKGVRRAGYERKGRGWKWFVTSKGRAKRDMEFTE